MNDEKRTERAVEHRRSSPSMHEDVPQWCDTCCCEPEPRWQTLAEEIERQEESTERDSGAGR